MSALLAFVTTPEFLTGSFVSGLLGTGLGHLSTRHNEKQKMAHEARMNKQKMEHEALMNTRKLAHEELMNKRKLAYDAATAFSAVCSGVIEKSMDVESVFNTFADYVRTNHGLPDAKAMEKIQYAVDLSNEMKQVNTAFNNLRMVAPVPVLDKANALLVAMMALTRATTQPLAKPPLLVEAGRAFEEFSNAIRADSGLGAYTQEDANKAAAGYMETLKKQVQDYIAQAREEFRHNGFPFPEPKPPSTDRSAEPTRVAEEPTFGGPTPLVPVRSLNVGETISLPIAPRTGTGSIGLLSTIRDFNEARTRMTVFVQKAGKTVTLNVGPDQQFIRVPAA